MHWLPVLFLSWMLIGGRFAAAEDAFSVRTWQIPDGSTNTVFGLAQAPDGYIWIGTTGGLNLFDGIEFQNRLLGPPYGLPDTRVRMILRSPSGAMWLAMDGAVVQLRTNQPPMVIKQNVPTQRVQSMVEDKDGALWLGYRSGRICRIVDAKATTFGPAEGFPADTSLPSLALDNNGQLWFARGTHIGTISDERYVEMKQTPVACFIARATSGGLWVCSGSVLYRFAGEMEQVATLPLPSNRAEPSRLFEDHTGALWIGTATAGLFRYDGSSVQTIATPQAQITCLEEDHEGNLWVGSDSGLNRVSPRAIQTEAAESGLPLGAARSICQAPDGTIWAIGANGAVMVRADSGWKPAPFAWDDSGYCITADATGVIWIGTQSRRLYRWKSGDLSRWDRASGVDGHVITALLAARNGDIWIGSTASSNLQCFRDGHFLNFKIPQGNGQVDALVEDRKGTILVGRSGNGGLLSITDDQVIDHKPGAVEWPVHTLLLTPDDTLWIAVYGHGLGRFKDGRLSMITPAQGLTQDHISQILDDGHGWLWLGTDSGIFKVSARELNECADGKDTRPQCIRFGGNQGLPPLQTRYGQFPNSLRSTDGRLWITTATALAIVHPERVRERLAAPEIKLQRILVDDQVVASCAEYIPAPSAIVDVNAATPLKLAPGYHRLEFDFTALTFSSPEDARFRYQLEGFDEVWNETSAPRKAIYPQLPAGKYRFHVIGCDANGNWNEAGAATWINVAPFFWETWWFISVASFTGISALVLVMRYIALRRLRRRLQILEQRSALDRERARIARDIHDDLGHGLTQIVLLSDVETDERLPSDELTDQLRQIATTAKQGIKSLDETVWAINPRNDTLPDVIDYLGEFVVQSIRAAGIRCELNLPDHPPIVPVPSEVRHNLFLAVKEAVNNALRHARAGKVALSITVDGQTIQLCVADDGSGFQIPHAHSQNGNGTGQHDGLRNMQQRMLDIGGTFELQSSPNSGTFVRLKLDLGCLNHNTAKVSKADLYADHSFHR